MKADLLEDDRPLPVQRSIAFDKAMAELIDNYLLVVRLSEQIAFFSITGFILLILRYFLWALCLWPALFVLVLNALTWGYATIRRRPHRRWGWVVIDRVVGPFVTLHQGEITGFKFLTLRGIVRILIYFRLSRYLGAITHRLQEAKLRDYVSSRHGTFDDRWYEQRIALLKDLKGTASERLGVAFWSSLTGAASFLGISKALYGLLPTDARLSALDFIKKLLFIPIVTSDAPQSIQSLQWTYYGLLVLTYLVWVIVTNFIEMRSTLKAARTYFVEQHALEAMKVPRHREVPIDLVGAAFLIASLMALSVMEEVAQGTTLHISWEMWRDLGWDLDILVSAIVVCLPLYAWIRRRKLNLA